MDDELCVCVCAKEDAKSADGGQGDRFRAKLRF